MNNNLNSLIPCQVFQNNLERTHRKTSIRLETFFNPYNRTNPISMTLSRCTDRAIMCRDLLSIVARCLLLHRISAFHHIQSQTNKTQTLFNSFQEGITWLLQASSPWQVYDPSQLYLAVILLPPTAPSDGADRISNKKTCQKFNRSTFIQRERGSNG